MRPTATARINFYAVGGMRSVRGRGSSGWRWFNSTCPASSSSSSSAVLRKTPVQSHTQRSGRDDEVRNHAQAHDRRESSITDTNGPTGSARLFSDALREEVEEERGSIPSTSTTGNATSNTTTAGLTGSEKLFADALLEESSSPSSSSSSSSNASTSVRTAHLLSQHTQQHQQDENWTGEERMQDAVLRMLVDKYKPLRGPVIRSAEEKLRERPPSLRDNTTNRTGGAEEHHPEPPPLLPSIEGHRPWHTTFTPPSALTPRVKLGAMAPSSLPSSSTGKGRNEDGSVKQDVAAARRSATAQRLGRARESMIDYKLGLSPSSSPSSSSPAPNSSTQTQNQTQTQQPRRPPPTSLKAWSNLIEERIERARLEGQFKSLKGRGKPIKRENEETNPFIAREEFLLNRIVQRNQAAPAWVELQGEVEDSIQTFRTILLQTWTKRAILLLTSSSSSRSPASLLSLTPSDARQLRDPGWVSREARYHAHALSEVNELVRRYNGVAPYAVRKPYFEREKELERCYWECGEDVVAGIRERVGKGAVGSHGGRRGGVGVGFGDDEEKGGCGGGGIGEERRVVGLWEIVRTWIASLRAS